MYAAPSFPPDNSQLLLATAELANGRWLGAPAAATGEAIAYQHLEEWLEQAPVAFFLLRGPAYVFDLVNPRAAASWGRLAEQVRGVPFFEALPDLRGQGYEAAYATVWQTQQVVTWREAPVMMVRRPAGLPELGYLNVSFQPFHVGPGPLKGILVTSHDVTEHVLARQQARQAAQELAALNAGLADYVTELTQAARVAQGLAEAQASTLAQLLELAPVAIGLFVGADYVVEVCTPGLLRLWGLTLAQVLHQPLAEVLPESQGSGFRELLAEAARTGLPVVGHPLAGHGVTTGPTVSFTCYPLRDAPGHTTAIAAVAGERAPQP